MSNKFKNWLVIINKTKNLNNQILLLCNINANMKNISKLLQLCIKLNTFNIAAIKALFQSYNLTFIKLFTIIRVVIIFSIFSIAIKTYLSSINIFNMIK